MKSRNLHFYLRWILGAVLTAAGLLKIFQPENLVEVILFFGLFSEEYALLVVYTIAVVEILLATLLILKSKPRVTNGLVFILFTCFLAIALIGYFDNWQFACDCLGRFSFGSFNGMMIIRNTILFGMASYMIFSTLPTNETLNRV